MNYLPFIALGALGFIALRSREKAKPSVPSTAGPLRTPKPSVPYAPPKPATSTDSYCEWLLTEPNNDLLYQYAMSSTSTACIEKAAHRLAAAGDTRAIDLTQKLADIRRGG